MASDSPPSPPPHGRPSVPTTATRATSNVADALPIDDSAQLPQRRSKLFHFSTKRGKPKTTPEHGCRSPLKKSSKVHRGPRASVMRLLTVDAAFAPVVISDSSNAPSPVSVVTQQEGDTSASSSKKQRKKPTRKKNKGYQAKTLRAKPSVLAS